MNRVIIRTCLCGAEFEAIAGPGRPRTTCDACRNEILRIYQRMYNWHLRHGASTAGLHAAAVDEWRRIHTDNGQSAANVEWRGVYGRNWDSVKGLKV